MKVMVMEKLLFQLSLFSFFFHGPNGFGEENLSQTVVPQWNRWEQVLISTENYDNPCKDVILSVSYTGPGWQRDSRIRFLGWRNHI